MTEARNRRSTLLAVLVVLGCAAHELGPRLAAAPGSSAVPSARRVALQLSGDELARFDSSYFAQTMSPVEAPIHDTRRDRFVLPGQWSVDREGVVTFDPDPLVGPDSAKARTTTELRAALDLREDLHVVIAVFERAEAIDVLYTVRWKNRERPHGERTKADVLLLRRVDSRTMRTLDELHLPLLTRFGVNEVGWEARPTVSRFLQDGSITAALDLAPWNRATKIRVSGGRIPVAAGSSHATVHLTANGSESAVTRRRWRTAVSWTDGTVFGVVDRKRSALLAFEPDGKQRFRTPLAFHPRAIGAHADGVCVSASTELGGNGQGVITCFDRDGRERWRRSMPSAPQRWLVDDDGWIYLSRQDDALTQAELIAVDPTGVSVWALREPAAVGELIAVGDDELCYVTEPNRNRRGPFVPELVCIHPRHGVAEQR